MSMFWTSVRPARWARRRRNAAASSSVRVRSSMGRLLYGFPDHREVIRGRQSADSRAFGAPVRGAGAWHRRFRSALPLDRRLPEGQKCAKHGTSVTAISPNKRRGSAMHRSRNVKIVATLGPASNDYEMIARAFRGGGRRVPAEHEPRRPCRDRRAGTRSSARSRHDYRPPDRHSGRPAGTEAALRRLRQRLGDPEHRPAFRFDLDRRPGDAKRVDLPHPEIFAALKPGARLLVNDGKIRAQVMECGPDFADCKMIGGRRDLEPQGRERARRGAAAGGAVRKGPPRSGIRLRAGRRLAGAVLRAAPRGRARGARAGQGPRGDPVEDREAGGGRRPSTRSSRSRTGSWWRAAISGSSCRSMRCRRSRSG